MRPLLYLSHCCSCLLLLLLRLALALHPPCPPARPCCFLIPAGHLDAELMQLLVEELYHDDYGEGGGHEA